MAGCSALPDAPLRSNRVARRCPGGADALWREDHRLGNVTISLSPEDEKTLKRPAQGQRLHPACRGFREYGVGAALKGIGEGRAAGRRRHGAACLEWAWGWEGSWVVWHDASRAQPGFGGGGAPPALCLPARHRRRDGGLRQLSRPNAPNAKFCSSCGTAIARPKPATVLSAERPRAPGPNSAVIAERRSRHEAVGGRRGVGAAGAAYGRAGGGSHAGSSASFRAAATRRLTSDRAAARPTA